MLSPQVHSYVCMYVCRKHAGMFLFVCVCVLLMCDMVRVTMILLESLKVQTKTADLPSVVTGVHHHTRRLINRQWHNVLLGASLS